jgi:hypothetical protein
MKTAPPNTSPISRWTIDAVYLWLLVCGLLGTVAYIVSTGPALNSQDFRAFYAAGHLIREAPSQFYDLATQHRYEDTASGTGPLLPIYHLAYEALLYAPLSFLSFKAAYFTYLLWNMLVLWFCYLLSPSGESIFTQRLRPVLFFLSFPPVLCSFVGQNSLLVLLVLCVTFRAFSRGRNLQAGLLLGLVILKLAIITPLALLLALRKGSRFLAGFLASCACVIGLSMALTGFGSTSQLLHLLAGATLSGDHSVQSQLQTAVWLRGMPNISGLLYLCGTGHLSAHSAFVVQSLADLILLAGCAFIQRRAKRDATALSAAIVCALLVGPHVYAYDLSCLILPMLLLSHRWLRISAVLWFVVPPVLYCYGFLTWLAPAVVVPLALLAVCIAQFREEGRLITDAPREGTAQASA